MNEPSSTKSTAGLVSDVMHHVTELVRKEFDLARAEISENVNRAGVAIGMIAGGLVIALVALNVLAAALVAALAEAGMGTGWAALLVAVVLGVVALILVRKGLGDLKLSSLAPRRTVDNIKRDAQVVQESYNER